MKDSARRFRFAAAYVSYAAVYIARMNLTIAAPALIEEGILTAWQIGLMGGVFFLLYSLGQLLNGWLGDIFSSRRMVTVGLLLTAASNVGIGLSLQADNAICLWALNGFAQSMLWGPLLRTVGCMYPSGKKSFAASVLGSSIGVGSVLGIALAAGTIPALGVRYAFLLPGGFAFLSAGMSFLLLPAEPRRHKRAQASEDSLHALLNPQLLILLIPALCHGILKDGINLWAATFFIDTYKIDLASMSFYVFAVPLLSLAGRLVYMPLYQLFRRQEHIVSIVSLGICAVCLIPLCLPGTPAGAAALCLGMNAAALSLVNASFLTIYPMKYQGAGCVSRVVGLLDFATYAGAGIGSLVYGKHLEENGYAGMFFSWMLLAAAAILLLGFIQRSGMKQFRFLRKGA
nr:MFS transporter [uncultured Acetatifactor sp.]